MKQQMKGKYIQQRAAFYTFNHKGIANAREREVARTSYEEGFYDAIQTIKSRAIYSSRGLLDHISEILR